jgi:hypothetical protein
MMEGEREGQEKWQRAGEKGDVRMEDKRGWGYFFKLIN